jgi:hypothetical protein
MRVCDPYLAHLGIAAESSAFVPDWSKPRIFEHVGEYPGGCTSDVAAPETGAPRKGIQEAWCPNPKETQTTHGRQEEVRELAKLNLSQTIFRPD